jgi:hypothetical protein
VDGAAKRIGSVLDQDILRRRLTELLRPEPPDRDLVGPLEAELAETSRQIDRLVDVLAAGTED